MFGSDWATGWAADDVVIDDGTGRPTNPDAVTRRLQRLRTRLGLGSFRLHDLRALFVTELFAADADLGLIARVAGHSDPAFTAKVYQRYRAADGKRAAEAIETALGDALRASGGEPRADQRRSEVIPLHPRES